MVSSEILDSGMYRGSPQFAVSKFADFTNSRFLKYFNSPVVRGSPHKFTVFPEKNSKLDKLMKETHFLASLSGDYLCNDLQSTILFSENIF